jgi:hypothetical protein
VSLDIDKLIISSHSFGAMTGIRASALDKRIKAVVNLDPWLYVYRNEVKLGKL